MILSNGPTFDDLYTAAKAFLKEAKVCATPSSDREPRVMGFGAVTLAFAAMVAFGEALCRDAGEEGRIDNDTSLKEFLKRVTDLQVFIVTQPRDSQQDRSAIVKLLVDTRNSLAHVLSLPNNVYLRATVADIESGKAGNFLVPSLFVESVSATISTIAYQFAHRPYRDARPRLAAPRSTVVTAPGASSPSFPQSEEKRDPPPG
jgi:hypothetical protein